MHCNVASQAKCINQPQIIIVLTIKIVFHMQTKVFFCFFIFLIFFYQNLSCVLHEILPWIGLCSGNNIIAKTNKLKKRKRKNSKQNKTKLHQRVERTSSAIACTIHFCLSVVVVVSLRRREKSSNWNETKKKTENAHKKNKRNIEVNEQGEGSSEFVVNKFDDDKLPEARFDDREENIICKDDEN